MPNQWSDHLFKSIVNDARTQNKDIADAVDALEDAPRRRLIQAVNDSRATIEDATREEFATLNQLQKQMKDDTASADSVAGDMAPSFRTAYYVSGTLVTILWLAVLLGYLIFSLVIGSYKAPWTWIFNTGGWPLLIAIFTGMIVLLVIRNRIVSRKKDLEKQARARMRVTLDIAGTQAKIDAASLKLEKRGVEAATQAWRKVINERLRPQYQTVHSFAAQRALEASVHPSQMVRTSAYSNLLFMLDHLDGSSIGIAGPRGAGKSTLLQWVCDDKQTKLGKREVLTVLTSAPVDYQARDFLLHLFASLCHGTIERLAPDSDYDRTNWKRHVAPGVTSGADVWRSLLSGAFIALFVGLLLWIASVTWAFDLASKPVGTAAKVMRAPAAGIPAKSAKPDSAASTQVLASFEPLSAARELGLTPAILFGAALILLSGASIALFSVDIRARRSMARTTSMTNRLDDEGVFKKSKLLLRFPLMRWYFVTRAALTPQPDSLPPSEIVQEALVWLQEIKFQQSYTMGWTGALKMPMGIEGSLTQARSMAQQQLTLPELVDAYRRFLKKIAARYTVIIGIDELDKIESDEKAQRFLNDIKIIFGVNNVFFLVSVSENAMSQFERRGLPFRDVFDTAFDDVIIVDHLRFEQSRRLLDERVLALPVQFQALCHVLSAGLARELVRTLRDLVRAATDAGDETPSSLDALVQRLIERDVSAKLAAYRAIAERLPPSDHREKLLQQAHYIGSVSPTAQSLHDSHLALLSPQSPAPRRWGRAVAVSEPGKHADVLALKEELATYLHFLAAVMGIFTANLDKAATQRAEKRGTFDDLATARRAQSTDQSLARSLVNKVLDDMRQTV